MNQNSGAPKLVKLPGPRLHEPFGQRTYPASSSPRGLGCLIAASTLFLLLIIATLFMPRGGDGAAAKNRKEVAELPTNVGYVYFEGISDSDLAGLPEMAEVVAVSFENCPELRGWGLKHLERTPQLRSVTFSACPNLEDAAAGALRRAILIESFRVYGTTKLTDAAVAELSLCEGLTSVVITESPGVSLTALKELRRKRPNCYVCGQTGDVSQSDSDGEHARHQAEKNRSNVPANR